MSLCTLQSPAGRINVTGHDILYCTNLFYKEEKFYEGMSSTMLHLSLYRLTFFSRRLRGDHYSFITINVNPLDAPLLDTGVRYVRPMQVGDWDVFPRVWNLLHAKFITMFSFTANERLLLTVETFTTVRRRYMLPQGFEPAFYWEQPININNFYHGFFSNFNKVCI